MSRHVLAATAFLALAACATQETETASAVAGGRDCFRNNDVLGYTIVDDHTVSVRAGGKDYLLTTRWNARDLDWSNRIAIRSANSWICTGNGLGVEITGGEPRQTYPIASVSRAPEAPPATGS